MADPPHAATPPTHRHRHTDESVYVVRGRLATRVDDEEAAYEQGSFVQITRGRWHTFWNPGDEPATYLVTITPQGLEGYFAELAAGLAARPSPAEAQALREKLFARYDVEMQSARAAHGAGSRSRGREQTL